MLPLAPENLEGHYHAVPQMDIQVLSERLASELAVPFDTKLGALGLLAAVACQIAFFALLLRSYPFGCTFAQSNHG